MFSDFPNGGLVCVFINSKNLMVLFGVAGAKIQKIIERAKQ
jgi:hypothetical protein